MMKEKIIPYQSSSKSIFIILGIILMLWSIVFSLFLIAQGAWPVSIFLGAEYLVIVFLIRLYFKEKNINDQISINEKEISIKKFKGDKLFYSSKFNTYWSKVFFTKQKNKSSKTRAINLRTRLLVLQATLEYLQPPLADKFITGVAM